MNNTSQGIIEKVSALFSFQYQLIQLKKQCIAYFGNERWLYIRHPKLNYVCPYRYIKTIVDIEVVRKLLEEDT